MQLLHSGDSGGMKLRVLCRGFAPSRPLQTVPQPASQLTRSASLGVGGAAELAERVERFCVQGIKLRASGSCAEPGVTSRVHLKLGHDAGCHALGVPRRAIGLTVGMWDRVGAGALILEAIDDAIAVLCEPSETGELGAWSPQLAAESLAYAIRTKITPCLAPERDETEPCN